MLEFLEGKVVWMMLGMCLIYLFFSVYVPLIRVYLP